MHPARPVLLLCGMLLCFWVLATWEVPPGEDLARYVTLTGGAWVVYVAALRATLSLPPSSLRPDLALILFVAVVARLTLLSAPPSLSDDVYRTVWDARVFHAGVNPYQYPPGAEELAYLRDDEVWPRVNHQEQRTPYPPLTLLLGAAAYAALPERLLAVQLLAVAADVLSVALMAWFLARCRLDPRRCVALAWSPLGIVHFAHSAHNDAAMIAATLGAAVALSYAPEAGRRVSAGRDTGSSRWAGLVGGLCLVSATAIKAVPALCLPWLARVGGPPAALGWALAIGASTLPFLSAGPTLLAGALEEGGQQRFNGSLHFAVERLAVAAGLPQPGIAASLVGLLVLAVVALALWRRADSSPQASLAAFSWIMAAYILVAPVVMPWYLTWLAPLVALRLQPGRGLLPFRLNDALAWLWLGGAITLTELSYLPNPPLSWPVIRAIEYVPTYALLAVAGIGVFVVRPRGSR